MSYVLVYWCGENQYSVITRKCVVSPQTLETLPVKGTCRWRGAGNYDADILKTGGKAMLYAPPTIQTEVVS